MTFLLELTESCTVGGFFLTLLINTILIYMTVLHIKNMTSTYKCLIVIFAASGLLFDGLQTIVKPYAHNYNSSLVFFSSNQSPLVSYNFLRKSLPCFAGAYSLMVSLISIMFFYRHLALKRSELLYYPKLIPMLFCILYALLFAVPFALAFVNFAVPDKYTDAYLREDFRRVHRKEIAFQPRYVVIPFNQDGEIRWSSILCISMCAFTTNVQYVLIFICGYKMRLNIRKLLHNSSYYHRSLENQYFNSLIAQITLPTLFLTLPTTIITLLLFGNFQLSLESGGMYILYAFYSPLESVLFMCIMSEYDQRVKEMYMKYSGVTNEWQSQQQNRQWVHTVI